MPRYPINNNAALRTPVSLAPAANRSTSSHTPRRVLRRHTPAAYRSAATAALASRPVTMATCTAATYGSTASTPGGAGVQGGGARTVAIAYASSAAAHAAAARVGGGKPQRWLAAPPMPRHANSVGAGTCGSTADEVWGCPLGPAHGCG